MVYLVIKELANTAEDVIMVTSSIMKDTAAVGSDVVYRANAIRALCRIIDVGSEIQHVRYHANYLCAGFHSTSDRTEPENSHCRQDTFRLFRRTRLLIPPPPHSTRHCTEMAIRDAGSSILFEIIWWLHGIRWCKPSHGRRQHQLHDPISRYWSTISDAIA
jgi:hypothetical protein